MAATVPGSSTLGISPEKRRGFQRVLGLVPEQNDQELYALFQADTTNRFYIPAVMQGHQSPPPDSSRTIHILGNDPRSKFLAHSLHGIYESVERITFSGSTPFANVSGSGKAKSNAWIEQNLSPASKTATEAAKERGHISNLIVAGHASQAVSLLQSVKHRVDDRTAICYMQDGLGIAEDVNNKVFRDAESRPSIILGHMTRVPVPDRKRNSLRLMKDDFETIFTGVRPLISQRDRQQQETRISTQWAPSESRLRTEAMLSSFAQARLLHARGVPLHSWLRHKIPSLMFASVADPICVMLGYRYEEIIFNPTANRLLEQLLNEIGDVVAHIPEVQQLGSEVPDLLRGEGMRKYIFKQLRGKRNAPSNMALQIERGQLTDIDYLNGYFIRRARRMGMKMPANEMVANFVKAKHKAVMEKQRSYIPLEVTSRR